MKRRNNIICGFAAAFCLLLLCSCTESKDRKYRELVNVTISAKKNIARLATVKYYEDMVLFDIQNGDTVAVIVAHPKLTLGIDLTELTEADFVHQGDTIFVNLPQPIVIDNGSMLNPKDYEILFSDKKNWNLDDRMKILSKQAKERIINDAIENGAMKRASNNAIKLINRLYSVSSSFVIEARIKEPEKELSIPSPEAQPRTN